MCEVAIVCPGEITDVYNADEKIYAKEPRLALALNVLTAQVKGKLEMNRDSYIKEFIEIKRVMHVLAIVADSSDVPTIEGECFVASLQTQDCRNGCGNCFLNNQFERLEDCFAKLHYDESKSEINFMVKEVD